jgi:ABC-2 type transport system permease protein
MNKILLVLKTELINVITRRSFLITLILLPVIGGIILTAISAFQKSSGADPTDLLDELMGPKTEISLEGFVDRSGLVKSVPPGYENQLAEYTTEEAARNALEDGTITAYYIIEPDFMETGKVVYVRPDFNPLGATVETSPVEALMAYALTDEDIQLSYRVQDPVNVTKVNLAPEEERDAENPLTFFLPYIVTFLFYTVILSASTLMLNSVTNEKENRVLEILMTSVKPIELLTGKIIALGITGLLQTVVWMGSGYVMLLFSNKRFALGDAFNLPPSVLVWGILFFLLGYAVYASLMAGVGALVPNVREASQLTTVVIMPMIVPLMFISVMINAPNSPLAVFLSIFPLTAPVSMMTRMAATSVPLWQSGLAAVLLAATAWLLVQATAKLFRAQTLLTGQGVNVVGFLKALAGK